MVRRLSAFLDVADLGATGVVVADVVGDAGAGDCVISGVHISAALLVEGSEAAHVELDGVDEQIMESVRPVVLLAVSARFSIEQYKN